MKKKKYLKPQPQFIFRLMCILFLLTAYAKSSFGQSTQTFTSSGTFTVPAGVTTVQVEAWGGGGAGGGVNGSSSSTRAGGGGSGGTYTKNLSVGVTPGANITVTVGAGGTGVSQADGNNGGTSTFASGTPVTAVGGGGGNLGTSSPNNGTGGGTSTGITFNGGTGANAASGNSGAGGGGAGSTGAGGNASGTTAGTGGAGGGGAGAAGLTSSGDGIDATALGGGGSGGRSTSSTDRTGGDGYRGQVKVTYTCVNYSLTATSGATPICVATGSSLITITGSAASLPVGSYTVTYNRSLPSATGLTAAMTVSAAGTGSFTAAGLTTAGASTITVTNLTSGAAGATCSSTISANNASVITVNSAPAISVQPIAQAICSGSPVTFNVTGTGSPAPTYQWKKAGVDISGATNSSFNIASVSVGDAASYTVVLTNTCSSVTSSGAALTINTAPSISVHPAPQTKCTGAAAAFSVTANGTPTPTYQWRKDGVNISGATTATYNIASVATGNAGAYDVVVTNTCATAASNAAALTVNVTPAAPAVTPSSTAVIAGQSASLTASGTGTSFAWYSAATGGTLLGSNAAFNTPGTCSNASYYAEQTSAAGCTSTRATVSVTATPLAAPAAVNGSICGLGNTTISGTPATGGNTCSWYAAASGGTALTVNSNSYNATMNASGPVTYYASTKLSTLGCESPARTAVTATALPEIIATPSISASSVCPSTLVTVGSNASRSGKSIVNVSIPLALFSTTNANSPLTVSGFSSALNNTSVKINYVKVNITHGTVANLRVRLVAPDAGVFNLTNQTGSGANYTNTVFQTGGAALTSGTAPYTGTFAPVQAFSNFNGKNPNGIWTLNVQNIGGISAAGTLVNWEINFIDANGLTYSWTSVPAGINSTSSSITDNPVQNSAYNLVVNGPGGCSENGSASVTMLQVPETSASNNSPVCVGVGLSFFGSNAASGQTTGNTYSWTGPDGFNSSSQNPGIGSASLVQSGIYTLTITNSSGCTSSTTTQVLVNPNPVLSISTQANVSCNGLSDGQVDIDATSGTSPFLFDLVGPSTTDGIFTGLTAGAYTATVSDDNGCVSSPLAVTVTEPEVLSFNSTPVNESCPGYANGSLTISATGGTAAYQYSIDNGSNFQNLNSFTNLSVGNYNLVVKDAHDCVTNSALAVVGTTPDITPPVIINNPASISKCIDLIPVTWTVPTATDNCTTPVLTSNHNPGEVFPVGVTTVVYTADDGNGNIGTSSFNVIVNALPTAVISNNHTICLGGSAQLHIDFTGTGPWNYVVSDGSQNISGTALNGSHDMLVTPSTQGDHTYSITSVSDANCTGTASGNVLVKVLNAPPAQNIISTVNTPAIACNGDVILITASASGGTGVSYSWNQGSSSMPVLFSENIGGPFTAGPVSTDVPQVYAQFVSTGGWSGYYICVKAVNACGNTTNKCKWVRGVVNAPGPISPATQTVACPDDIMNYSCGASNGATIYNWTLNGSPAPISPNGGNNTNIQVTFPSTFISGQLCVTASLACQGLSASAPRCISINKNPAGPSSITGINAVCSGTTGVSYSIQAVSGASGYNWTVPLNATIATGANSPSITVDFPTSFTGSHSVCVTATSACGASTTKCKTVVSGIPNKPAGITGPLANVCGSTVQYSVVNPQAGLTYTWTNPSGTTISGSASGSTILLNVSPTFTNGFLTVVANSALCAPATSVPRTSSTFWGRPNTPGAITGNPELWCSGGYVNFSVAPAAPLPTYTWTVTNGTIDAGQGSNNIDVTWGANVAGTVSVKASNGCGISAGISSQSFSSGCREEGVNTSSEVAFSVYPNPAYENVTLNFNSIEKQNVHIELIDLSGRAVQSVVYDADKGMNKVMIDLKKFSKGAYIVQIKSDKLYQQLPIILQ